MSRFTDEQVRAAILGKRKPRVIPFPGAPPESGIKVGIRVLTEAELDACRLEAQRIIRSECEKRKWDPTTFVDIDPSALIRHQERQLVLMSFLDAESIGEDKEQRRFFPTLKDVESLDATTLTRCREAYDENQEWVSPVTKLSQEEALELVASMGNESSASVELHRFERSTLVRLCITLASALRSST
jgi:hypothetical protein